jgi:hypothetical protein
MSSYSNMHDDSRTGKETNARISAHSGRFQHASHIPRHGACDRPLHEPSAIRAPFHSAAQRHALLPAGWSDEGANRLPDSQFAIRDSRFSPPRRSRFLAAAGWSEERANRSPTIRDSSFATRASLPRGEAASLLPQAGARNERIAPQRFATRDSRFALLSPAAKPLPCCRGGDAGARYERISPPRFGTRDSRFAHLPQSGARNERISAFP